MTRRCSSCYHRFCRQRFCRQPSFRQLTYLLWVLTVTAILSACAPVAPTAPAAVAEPPAATQPAAVAEPPALTYQNPVFNQDFPDPFILTTDDGYYAYSTSALGKNIQVLRSDDLFTWERTGTNGDALPKLPAWTRKGMTWAPSVLQRGDEYILYYVTHNVAAGRQCISYAVANSPAGPFVDNSTGPFVCQLDEGGSIDPEPFVDQDGTAYLLWKSDANAIGRDASLYSQRLGDDGRTLIGEPVRLITRDQDWEDPLIENPSLTLHDGKYYLVYSGNWWESPAYALGIAECESPLGPCVKPLDEPWFQLRTGRVGDEVGPGGGTWVHAQDGSLWLAYHAWRFPSTAYPVGQRRLSLARVEFQDGKPIVFRPEPAAK